MAILLNADTLGLFIVVLFVYVVNYQEKNGILKQIKRQGVLRFN